MQVKHITPILNVSDLAQSFAWFEALGWKKGWEWGEPLSFGGVNSGHFEIFLCLDGQGGRRARIDADRGDLLAGEVTGPQVRDMVGGVHRAGVGVGRAMGEQVLHAQSPPEEPTAWAAGTCEK